MVVFDPYNKPILRPEPPCPPREEQEPPAQKCKARISAPVNPPREAEWPAIIDALVNWCQDVGKSLRSESRLSADTVCTLVAAFIEPAGDDATSSVVQKTISDLWTAGGTDFDLGGLLDAWHSQTSRLLGYSADRLLNVLAVKAVLQAVLDQAVAYDRSQNRSDQRGLSLGI